MLDVVYREETLLNVIKSVTRNGRSIILTAVLAVILIYLFSIIGYMFFKDDFIMEVDPALETLQLAANSECLAPGSQCWSSVGRACLHLCQLAANSECLAPGSQCWSSVGCASLHLCHSWLCQTALFLGLGHVL